MLLAEGNHSADSCYRHPRALRAGLVVQSAVQHAAVVSALVPARSVLFFEEQYFHLGMPKQNLVRRRQPYDSTANN